MQFVSEGSANPSYNNNSSAREEVSNPEPPRFAEEGKSLYERLKDNQEKKFQFDQERVTAGGPSAISEEEYMFFIELERKQKHISKQVDRETEAFQKQVQTLTYQPDTSLLTLVAHKTKHAKKDKKPTLNVRPKLETGPVHSGEKRKTREDEELPGTKRRRGSGGVDGGSVVVSSVDGGSAAITTPHSVPITTTDASESGSGLAALLGYGSDEDEDK